MKPSLTLRGNAVLLGALMIPGIALTISWRDSERDLKRLTVAADASGDSVPAITSTERTSSEKVWGSGTPYRQGTYASGQPTPSDLDVGASSLASSVVGRQNGADSLPKTPPRAEAPRLSSVIQQSANPKVPESLLGSDSRARQSFSSTATTNLVSPNAPAMSPGFQSRKTAAPQPPVPAVFADPVIVASLPLDQQEAISGIARGFSEAMNASGANPTSPEYSSQWNRAVQSADEIFEAQYGIDAFNALQRAR
jgi:hypothetical protein